MRRTALAFSLAIAFTGVANAQQIMSAGGLYAGPAQHTAVCYFYNSGTTSVSIGAPQLTSQFGSVLPLTTNQCGSPLSPANTCGIAATVQNNQPYSCKALISPNKANLRGILELRDSGQVTLQNAELR